MNNAKSNMAAFCKWLKKQLLCRNFALEDLSVPNIMLRKKNKL